MRAGCERDCCARSRILCFRSGGAPGISDGFQPGVPIRHNKQPGPVGTTGNHIPKIPLCSLVSLWFQKVCSVILLDRIQDGDFLHLKVIMSKYKETKRNLADLFWEYQLTEKKLQDCLKSNDLDDPLTVSLYNRLLLSTPNWYEVLNMLSPEQLKAALSEKVISTIHSPALQERFRFAYSRLYPGK